MSEFNRSARVSRGGEGRGQGSGASSSAPREAAAVTVSLSTVASVHRAADLTQARADQHYEKHREAWVDKAHTKLLLKGAPTLAPSPSGVVNDPKVALITQATREVAQRHSQRLTRIDNARYAMIATGKLRTNRDLEWSGQARATSERGGNRQLIAVDAAGGARSTREMRRDKGLGD